MMLPQYYQGQPLNSYAYPQMQYGMSSPVPSPQQVGMQQPVKKPPTANGPQSAMQYPMGPNEISNAIFDEDMSKQIFYMLTTDGMGTKVIEGFKFYKIDLSTGLPADQRPATHDDLQKLAERVELIERSIDGIHGQDAPEQPAAAQPE